MASNKKSKNLRKGIATTTAVVPSLLNISLNFAKNSGFASLHPLFPLEPVYLDIVTSKADIYETYKAYGTFYKYLV